MIALFLAAYAGDIPLTHDACLRDAVAANARVQRARLDVEAAGASIKSSLGFFDPTAGFDGNWRNSRSKGFFQGFPFESDSKTWDLGANLRSTLPTGTTVGLNASFDRNFSSFVTDFGVGGLNEQIQDAYTSNFNVSVTQQILKGIKLSYNLQNVQRAQRAMGSAELRAEEAAQETLADTSRAYWSWTYQDDLALISEAAFTSSKEALRVAELKLQAGEIAPLERTRLKAAAVQAEVNQMETQLASKQALQALLLLTGQEERAYTPATEPLQGELPTLDAEQAVAVALAGSLQLRLARASLDEAGIDLSNAKHAMLPTLSGTASAGTGAQDGDAGKAFSDVTSSEANPWLALGGSFSMPLGNRAARGERSRAAVQVERAQVDLSELKRSLRSQVLRQVDIVNSGSLRVRLASTNLELARESLAAEEALQAAGRSIQKNLLDARSERTRTEAEVSKARTDHQLALVELQRLQGGLTASSSGL